VDKEGKRVRLKEKRGWEEEGNRFRKNQGEGEWGTWGIGQGDNSRGTSFVLRGQGSGKGGLENESVCINQLGGGQGN